LLRDAKLIILISVPEDYMACLLHVSLVKVTPGGHGKEIIYTKNLTAELPKSTQIPDFTIPTIIH